MHKRRRKKPAFVCAMRFLRQWSFQGQKTLLSVFRYALGQAFLDF